ncbi:hypothetical protein F5J12DRAFT_794951 [Pisolithus orientalis]|uniref:uncharacterized protein n=1 Tax=Pisolithus orientalis TaxID=936130 RepID=UPI002223FCE2|nr:uncharacterized protein F5J12DRAFT_794951 [Pisolithus orientalis]KAI6035648.1 hypothetical protein F5J12DRAFT_794951 [Pisolithus orientalis]
MCCNNAGPAGVSVLPSQVPSMGQDGDQCQVEVPRNVVHGSALDTMTPAQAYAYAVKTGQDYNRTLHYTIERKQPLRSVQDQPPPLPLSSINAGTERGGLYAQRLYASATSNKSSSSLPGSSSSPSRPTQPIDKPLPVAPPGPDSSRPLSRSQHHRSSSLSPSSLDTRVPNTVTQRFNVADLYHSSLPRGDFRSLRTLLSGPGAHTTAGGRTEPAPLSAPPLHSPTPLVGYPRLQTSVSQTQLPRRSGDLSSPPLSPESFRSSRARCDLSAYDVQLNSNLDRPLLRETPGLRVSSSVSVPTVYIMTPPSSTSPLSTFRTDRPVGRGEDASPSFSRSFQRRSVPVLRTTSSAMSPSPLISERPSSISPDLQGDLPCYTAPDPAISSLLPPFGDEKSAPSKLPCRSTSPSPARSFTDRRILPTVPPPSQSPRMTTPIISATPPPTVRSPPPPSRSPLRSIENSSVTGKSPPSHSETKPMGRPAEQLSVER